MFSDGIRVRMTKGYRGSEGTIVLKTDSKLELYLIALDSGLRIVAGPSAFVLLAGEHPNRSACLSSH